MDCRIVGMMVVRMAVRRENKLVRWIWVMEVFGDEVEEEEGDDVVEGS